MSIQRVAVKIGTAGYRQLDPGESPRAGEVEYVGHIAWDGDTYLMVWDNALQNIREKRQAERDADAAARQAVEANLQDLRDRFAQAVIRLDDIVTNGGTYTNVQVRAAVVDMAQIQRFMLRAMRRQV